MRVHPLLLVLILAVLACAGPRAPTPDNPSTPGLASPGAATPAPGSASAPDEPSAGATPPAHGRPGGASRGQPAGDLGRIRLPPGFRIAEYARDLPGARSLARAEGGTVFVGTRQDRVHALTDADGDQVAEKVRVVARGLDQPNGVALRNGALYVGEISRILRFDGIEQRLDAPGEPQVVTDALPRERHHGRRFMAFGPDGMLYVGVGAPCNVCLREDDERFASILRMKPDGSGHQVFARGIRNTLGFDWNPETGTMWFTDNGRDMLGDDRPPDELNQAAKAGLHFGFPFCHGGDVLDPEFGAGHSCSEFTAPAMKLGPHVASLGMRFYRGRMFPEEYRGDILIAEHGSWNRSIPLGYRLTRVRVEGDRALSYQVFAEGWLQGGRPWGRPVDVLEMPDGALLVSDDHAGRVYRISYSGAR